MTKETANPRTTELAIIGAGGGSQWEHSDYAFPQENE